VEGQPASFLSAQLVLQTDSLGHGQQSPNLPVYQSAKRLPSCKEPQAATCFFKSPLEAPKVLLVPTLAQPVEMVGKSRI
jgi:hypothetical protein